MKGFIFVTLLIASSFIGVGKAQAQGDPVFFEAVKPCDILTGVGLYLKDVGTKTVNGTKTIIKGTGRVITSPFRARFQWPKPKIFRYERGYFVPPKLEQMPTTPPKVELGIPVEPEQLKFIPIPHIEPDVRATIVLFETRF
tara:strand:- start:797 stop:1219 length:423 start_codon:yes stop_codon:yes gene_type:complete